MPSPGGFLGLPPGFPDVTNDVAGFRYLLVGLALAWAALVARARAAPALAAGALFALAATGFWILALGRPYGLLEDPAITSRAAEVAVAAASGEPGRSFLADEPSGLPALPALLLRLGMGSPALLFLPSFAPALNVVAIGLLVSVAWAPRGLAPLAAALWLAFATGDLEGVRLGGHTSGLWAHPDSALVQPVAALMVLLVARLPWPAAARAASAALVLASGFVVPAGAGPGLGGSLLLLTLDQTPWLWLACWGWRRGADAASVSLVAGGGALVLLAALGLPLDPWHGASLYRLGLLLGSARPLVELARRVLDSARPDRWRLVSRLEPERLAAAGILALLLPGSWLTWWDPNRADPVARASLEPIPAALDAPLTWLRESTPADAVLVASPDYAPAVAVLSGRRVLRAPSLRLARDETARVRAEGALLAGRPLPSLARDHGARFVLIAPGDFRARGIAGPEDLEGRPGLSLRYSDANRFRVYEIVR